MSFNYSSTAVKSKRSQSALEYMMTYGWAILIIVIVAVILYSMGIFNPSSSITFTSSGFSPFTVSSSLCNNIGYKIAVLAGPIPNNANSLTINKVFLTSATGANTTTTSYALTNPVTLKSGQSATILIPNVACNSANIHYSLSAKIQYSYDVPTIGLQTVNTTGTVAGTSITGKPSTLTTYEPITITNTQSSATPSPFQQMINFTSSDPGFSSIATGNFGQNVEFFYYNGTIIPSWLENYTSTNAIWWLKIAAIPAGSSETVYVGFVPASANLFNTVNDGEAPQLSSTYAEYDDGANVFLLYFNGDTPLSDFNTPNTLSQASVTGPLGNTIKVINITGSASNYGFVYIGKSILNQPIIAESSSQQNGLGVGGLGADNGQVSILGSTSSINLNAISVDIGGGGTYFLNDYFLDGVQTRVNAVGSANADWHYALVAYPGSSATNWSGYISPQFYSASGGYSGSVSNNPLSSSTSLYIGLIGAVNADDTWQTYINWMCARAYPPNGIMPSVSFGSVA